MLPHAAAKIPFMYSQKRISRPPFLCLWAIYIFPGSVNIFSCSRIGRPSVQYINCSQTHECEWKLGLAAQFLFWEYLFRIFVIVSLQCARSRSHGSETCVKTHLGIRVVWKGREGRSREDGEGPEYPSVCFLMLHVQYLELWVGLAASHGDVSLYPEPGGPVRVSQPHTLALHVAKIQVHTQGYLQVLFSHDSIKILKWGPSSTFHYAVNLRNLKWRPFSSFHYAVNLRILKYPIHYTDIPLFCRKRRPWDTQCIPGLEKAHFRLKNRILAQNYEYKALQRAPTKLNEIERRPTVEKRTPYLQMKVRWESNINVLFGISFTLKPNKKLTARINSFHLCSVIFQIWDLYFGHLCELSPPIVLSCNTGNRDSK
jgi:hypothetical protein